LPGFAAGVWQGILAPAGTPKEVIAKLYRATARILQQPEVREQYASVGFEPVGSTPEAFGAFLKADIAKWAKVVQRSGRRWTIESRGALDRIRR